MKKTLHNFLNKTYDLVLKPILNIEVLSDSGWQSITSLNITHNQLLITIQTQNGKTLSCTKDHILIDADGNEFFAKDAKGKIIHTQDSIDTIIDVLDVGDIDTVYDLSLNDTTSHTYFTNGILSHNCLIVDECAFIPKNIIDEFWASVMPIVSSSKKSKVVVVSTPNGASGKFYELWQAANSKEVGGNKEGWQPFRINWWEVPGRDEEWKALRIASEGMQVWKLEYECDFLTSSSIHKLIPDEVILKYRQKLAELKVSGASAGKKQKIMAESGDKLYEFTVWHEFLKNHTYLASGDISEGVGGDSSVLYVWDVTDLSNITQCAKFASNTVSVVEFAFVISRILKLYNNPYFVAERNGISGGTLDALRITYLYPRLVREGKNGEPGIYSHVVTKGKACIWAKEMFNTEGFGFTFYDHDILDEADTFVKKDTLGVHVVYHALPPAHDDFMMSLIWLCYVLKNEIVEKYFQVLEAFKSANDVIYAKRLAPLQDYTALELKAVTEDPLYKEYLEFKEEMSATLKDVLKRGGALQDDVFGFNSRNEDSYFGGFDDSPSWNAPNLQLPPNQLGTSDNRPPLFYFSGGCGFSQF